MSREDFDFINLSENIERNTKDLLKEQASLNRTVKPITGSQENQSVKRGADISQERRMQRETESPKERQIRREVERPQGRQTGKNEESEEWWEDSRKEENRQRRSYSQSQDKRNSAMREAQGRRQEESRKNARVGNRDEGKGRRGLGMSGKKRKKSSRLKKKLIAVGCVVALLFLGLYALSYSIVSKTNYEKLETDYVRPADVEKVRGVKNILLIGTDARSSEEDGRSDSMIILSINSKKNRMVMTSILRDSYVEIPGHGNNRINAAYSYGQEDLLIQTIEQNFKIPIDAYAKVDFFSFIDIVDAVGGVEIDVTDEEMKWINAYLNETNELLGKEFGDGYLTQSGRINLTGKQALSYARIRYIGTDFQRTERQREILSAVAAKVKANPSSVSKLMGTVLPKITTNIPDTELTLMGMKAPLYLGYDVEQIHLPADGTWSNATINKMSVLQLDFEKNIQYFKDVVYGEGVTEPGTTE